MATTEDSFAEKLAHWRKHGAPGVLRTGFANATHTTVKVNDHTGERVGTETEHWSGRVDATAERMTVTVNPALQPKESADG